MPAKSARSSPVAGCSGVASAAGGDRGPMQTVRHTAEALLSMRLLRPYSPTHSNVASRIWPRPGRPALGVSGAGVPQQRLLRRLVHRRILQVAADDRLSADPGYIQSWGWRTPVLLQPGLEIVAPLAAMPIPRIAITFAGAPEPERSAASRRGSRWARAVKTRSTPTRILALAVVVGSPNRPAGSS